MILLFSYIFATQLRNKATNNKTTEMKYCTFKQTGNSFIYGDGYLFNPVNGDNAYIGEETFKNAFINGPLRKHLVIRDIE